MHFTVKQKGYGRQGLYVEDLYIQDVYPNVREHFNIADTENAFEIDGKLVDGSGHELADTYTDLDEWLFNRFKHEIEMLIDEMEDEEEEEGEDYE